MKLLHNSMMCYRWSRVLEWITGLDWTTGVPRPPNYFQCHTRTLFHCLKLGETTEKQIITSLGATLWYPDYIKSNNYLQQGAIFDSHAPALDLSLT